MPKVIGEACGSNALGRGSDTGCGNETKDEENYVTDTQKCGAARSIVPRTREHRNGSLTKTESLCFLRLLLNSIVLL